MRLRAAKVEAFMGDDDDADAEMGSDAMATIGASAGDGVEGGSEIVICKMRAASRDEKTSLQQGVLAQLSGGMRRYLVGDWWVDEVFNEVTKSWREEGIIYRLGQRGEWWWWLASFLKRTTGIRPRIRGAA